MIGITDGRALGRIRVPKLGTYYLIDYGGIYMIMRHYLSIPDVYFGYGELFRDWFICSTQVLPKTEYECT